jgi:hypothetical protein
LNDFLCPPLNLSSVGFCATIKTRKVDIGVVVSGVGVRMRNVMYLGRRIGRAERHRGRISGALKPLRENIIGGSLGRRRL